MSASPSPTSSLTSRQQATVDRTKAHYQSIFYSGKCLSTEFVHGFHLGFKEAMKTMYRDAEMMFSEDKQAADLVLTAIALEGLANA